MTQVLVRLVADILDYLRLSIWQAPPTLAATTYTSSRLKIIKIPIPHVRPIHTLEIASRVRGGDRKSTRVQNVAICMHLPLSKLQERKMLQTQSYLAYPRGMPT